MVFNDLANNTLLIILVILTTWTLITNIILIRLWFKIKKLTQSGIYTKLNDNKYVQSAKLMRFNPFNEVGGDQSFVIALLDGRKNGIVLSSLYSRDKTRWFAKKVKEGKGDGYKLSKEEKTIINE